MFGRRIKSLFSQREREKDYPYPGTEDFLEKIETKMYELSNDTLVRKFNDLTQTYEFILKNGATILVQVSIDL